MCGGEWRREKREEGKSFLPESFKKKLNLTLAYLKYTHSSYISFYQTITKMVIKKDVLVILWHI